MMNFLNLGLFLFHQAFYPIGESYTIQPGDILATRCTYDSDKDIATYAG